MTQRYVTLDHWRGLACLAVLVNHSVLYPSGGALGQGFFAVAQRLWLGVPIFFVISGYCIAAAVDTHVAGGRRPLLSYFTRRFRRIFPPYWAVLFATVSVVAALDLAIPRLTLTSSGAFLRGWWYGPTQWLGNLSLTETWRHHLMPGQKALILDQAWTLCYEEQFYAVAGLLLWAVPGWFFAGTVGVTVFTAAAVIGLPSEVRQGFFFDGSWFQFWFGVLVYRTALGARAERLAALVLLVGVAAVQLSHGARLTEPGKNVTQELLVASLFAVAILLLRRHDLRLRRVLLLRPFEICGAMCYSLYLVHQPIVKIVKSITTSVEWHPTPFASLALCAPLCLTVAWLFHTAVERRFLGRREIESAAPASLAASA